MNSKAFFGFLIAISFTVIIIHAHLGQLERSHSLKQTKNLLLQAEKANFQRTIIEENTDYFIKQNLTELLSKTSNMEEIKQEMDKRLLGYFKKTEEIYGISFATEQKQPVSLQHLQETTKALVLDSEAGIAEAEYSFTGGENKNKKITAKITEGKAEQEFMLPAGYTIKTTVVK